MKTSFPLPPATGLSIAWATSLVETLQEAARSLHAGKQDVGAPVQLVSATVADLNPQEPSLPRFRASQAGRIVWVTDDATGAQPAYADGVTWRRFRDGQPVA